jgi:tRNA G10  N-methylase Trm11
MKYLIQCVSGLQDVVAGQLTAEPFGQVRVEATEEGFVLIETAASPDQIRTLRYLNNAFLVLGHYSADGEALESAVRRLGRDAHWQTAAARATASNERTFRLMLYDAGQLVSAPPALLQRAHDVLARSTGMRRRGEQADTEFWFIRRKSGRIFFCKRVSRRTKTEKDLLKGELRPELTHLLCLLSEPSPGDAFLDPFVGSGAIPLARAALPYRTILCFDSDANTIAALRTRLKQELPAGAGRSPVIVKVGDARRLDAVEDGSIDRVVTDPPWGFFDGSLGDPLDFYRAVLAELSRVTRPGGLVIVLLGRRELVQPLTDELSTQLSLLARYDVLVAGKKAVVLKWRRTSQSALRASPSVRRNPAQVPAPSDLGQAPTDDKRKR